jgi:hypothetical protein
MFALHLCRQGGPGLLEGCVSRPGIASRLLDGFFLLAYSRGAQFLDLALGLGLFFGSLFIQYL